MKRFEIVDLSEEMVIDNLRLTRPGDHRKPNRSRPGRLRRSPGVNTGRAQPLAGDRLRREVPAAAGFSSLYGKVDSAPGNEQVDATRRS